MTRPDSYTVLTQPCWRLIAWSRPTSRPVHIWLTPHWTIDRTEDEHGMVRAEITPHWTGEPADMPSELHYVLVPRRFIPPSEPSPTIGELAVEFDQPTDAAVPYSFGDGDSVRDVLERAVQGGDDRMRELCTLAERHELAWNLERLTQRHRDLSTGGRMARAKKAVSEGPQTTPETPPVPTELPCQECGLLFSDPWILGTHRGSAHRVAHPRCPICGTSNCGGPIGRAIHAGHVTKETEVNDAVA